MLETNHLFNNFNITETIKFLKKHFLEGFIKVFAGPIEFKDDNLDDSDAKSEFIDYLSNSKYTKNLEQEYINMTNKWPVGYANNLFKEKDYLDANIESKYDLNQGRLRFNRAILDFKLRIFSLNAPQVEEK